MRAVCGGPIRFPQDSAHSKSRLQRLNIVFVRVWVAGFSDSDADECKCRAGCQGSDTDSAPPVYPLHAADPHAQGAVEVPEAPADRDHQGPVAVCPVDVCLSRRASRQEGCVIGVLAQEVSSPVLVAIFDQIPGVK